MHDVLVIMVILLTYLKYNLIPVERNFHSNTELEDQSELFTHMV